MKNNTARQDIPNKFLERVKQAGDFLHTSAAKKAVAASMVLLPIVSMSAPKTSNDNAPNIINSFQTRAAPLLTQNNDQNGEVASYEELAERAVDYFERTGFTTPRTLRHIATVIAYTHKGESIDETEKALLKDGGYLFVKALEKEIKSRKGIKIYRLFKAQSDTQQIDKDADIDADIDIKYTNGLLLIKLDDAAAPKPVKDIPPKKPTERKQRKHQPGSWYHSIGAHYSQNEFLLSAGPFLPVFEQNDTFTPLRIKTQDYIARYTATYAASKNIKFNAFAGAGIIVAELPEFSETGSSTLDLDTLTDEALALYLSLGGFAPNDPTIITGGLNKIDLTTLLTAEFGVGVDLYCISATGKFQKVFDASNSTLMHDNFLNKGRSDKIQLDLRANIVRVKFSDDTYLGLYAHGQYNWNNLNNNKESGPTLAQTNGPSLTTAETQALKNQFNAGNLNLNYHNSAGYGLGVELTKNNWDFNVSAAYWDTDTDNLQSDMQNFGDSSHRNGAGSSFFKNVKSIVGVTYTFPKQVKAKYKFQENHRRRQSSKKSITSAANRNNYAFTID